MKQTIIMKNVLGTTENLELFNSKGIKVYELYKNSVGYSSEYTRDNNGNTLTFKNSEGYSYECTYDVNGNILTYKDSDGFSSESAYDENGNILTYKNSDEKRDTTQSKVDL